MYEIVWLFSCMIVCMFELPSGNLEVKNCNLIKDSNSDQCSFVIHLQHITFAQYLFGRSLPEICSSCVLELPSIQ